MNTVERAEVDRDPILRLDQLIHRQDQMLSLAARQLKILQILGLMHGCLLCFALAILIFLAWK